MKYYITKNPLEDDEIYGFEFEEKYNNLYIYKNKNAFNIGYYLAENIEESYNPFKMQNEFISGLIANNKIENEKYFQNIEKSEILNCKKIIDFNEETKEYMIKYNVKAKKDCNIYLSSDYDLQIYINDEPQFKNYSNIWSTETGIKQIKYLKQDEELKFTLKTKQNLELLYLYVSNNEEIQKILNNKNNNFFTDIEINKNGLAGTANFKDDGYLVFGISYDKHWKIFVDGKESKSKSIAGCFLGTKLEKGKHEIKIEYNTKFT